MERTHTIDVDYLGKPNGIAACALETGEGLAIVDPGPASSLGGLRRGLEGAGLSIGDVRAILLTHIHLDHAGATGALVRDNPRIRVFVHERGAPHVIDPSRLLSSALRIYGDSLETLFGTVEPVPADRVTVLRGGETIEHGGRRVRVESAPGHAVHHVAFIDEETGTAFVGDTAGERFAPHQLVMPVTPPPDIDLERWRETLGKLRGLRPARLFVTHFGGFDDVVRHLDEHETRLESWARSVRGSLDEPGTDAERAERFAAGIEAEVLSSLGRVGAIAYAHAGLRESWFGLARYWRKRQSG